MRMHANCAALCTSQFPERLRATSWVILFYAAQIHLLGVLSLACSNWLGSTLSQLFRHLQPSSIPYFKSRSIFNDVKWFSQSNIDSREPRIGYVIWIPCQYSFSLTCMIIQICVTMNCVLTRLYCFSNWKRVLQINILAQLFYSS